MNFYSNSVSFYLWAYSQIYRICFVVLSQYVFSFNTETVFLQESAKCTEHRVKRRQCIQSRELKWLPSDAKVCLSVSHPVKVSEEANRKCNPRNCRLMLLDSHRPTIPYGRTSTRKAVLSQGNRAMQLYISTDTVCTVCRQLLFSDTFRDS